MPRTWPAPPSSSWATTRRRSPATPWWWTLAGASAARGHDLRPHRARRHPPGLPRALLRPRAPRHRALLRDPGLSRDPPALGRERGARAHGRPEGRRRSRGRDHALRRGPQRPEARRALAPVERSRHRPHRPPRPALLSGGALAVSARRGAADRPVRGRDRGRDRRERLRGTHREPHHPPGRRHQARQRDPRPRRRRADSLRGRGRGPPPHGLPRDHPRGAGPGPGPGGAAHLEWRCASPPDPLAHRPHPRPRLPSGPAPHRRLPGVRPDAPRSPRRQQPHPAPRRGAGPRIPGTDHARDRRGASHLVAQLRRQPRARLAAHGLLRPPARGRPHRGPPLVGLRRQPRTGVRLPALSIGPGRPSFAVFRAALRTRFDPLARQTYPHVERSAMSQPAVPKGSSIIEDLYRVPDNGKAEIVEGELVLMSPTGFLPGRASWAICASWRKYEEGTGRGYALPDNAGFHA